MDLSVSIRLYRLLLLPSIVVALANAQIRPALPSATDLKSAKAQCDSASTFQLNHLENSPGILSAANDVADQMVARYKADPTKQPDMSDQWGMLLLAIISSADPSCVAKTIASDKTTKAATAQATTSQTNKQIGAPPSSDGSTSPVQKVGVPQLLGIAVDNGAVTNNVTGTTMTLSTSPYGFIAAFRSGDDTQSTYYKYRLVAGHIGASATFNVASSTNALASATRKQVSQWQVKWTFRDTSVRSPVVPELFKQYVKDSANAIVADASSSILDAALYRPLARPVNMVYIQSWGEALQPLLSEAPAATDTDGKQKAAGLAKQLLHLLDSDPTCQKALNEALAEQSSNLTELVQKYQADNAEYQRQEALFEKAIADIPKGWNGDALFGQRFPTTTTSAGNGSGSSATSHIPDYLLGEVDITCDPKTVEAQQVPCPLGKHTSVTGNLSSSFYTTPNGTLNEKTFRGAQAALQAQWSLGYGFTKIKSANDKSQLTLAVSASYQRLQENKDQNGKRPDIVLGTIKLEIPISGGTSVPLSFSVANATEQVKETYVKGNFGISFDLDKLASLLKANQ
jgi:hypothetical protein